MPEMIPVTDPEREAETQTPPAPQPAAPAVDEEALRLQAIRQDMLDGKPVQKTDAMRALAQIQDIAWWDDEPVWLPIENGPVPDLKPGEILMRDPGTLPRECWARHRFNLKQPGGHGLQLADQPTFVAVYQGTYGLRFMAGYKLA